MLTLADQRACGEAAGFKGKIWNLALEPGYFCYFILILFYFVRH